MRHWTHHYHVEICVLDRRFVVVVMDRSGDWFYIALGSPLSASVRLSFHELAELWRPN